MLVIACLMGGVKRGVRIGSHREGKGAALGALCPERVLGPIDPIIHGIPGRVVLHPVVILRVGGEPGDGDFVRLAAGGRIVGGLSQCRILKKSRIGSDTRSSWQARY